MKKRKSAKKKKAKARAPSSQLAFDFAAGPKSPPRRSLIQPFETARITKDAIERAEHLTDDHRKIEYLQAIRAVAEMMEYFRCDHVWDYLGRVGDGGRDNGSGLGPMMRLACASGIMRPANEFERSQRGPTHGRPQRLWKSLIYKGAPAIPPGNAQPEIPANHYQM